MEYIPKSRPHDSCGYESGSGLTLTRQKGGGRGLTQAAALLLLLQDSLLLALWPSWLWPLPSVDPLDSRTKIENSR